MPGTLRRCTSSSLAGTVLPPASCAAHGPHSGPQHKASCTGASKAALEIYACKSRLKDLLQGTLHQGAALCMRETRGRQGSAQGQGHMVPPHVLLEPLHWTPILCSCPQQWSPAQPLRPVHVAACTVCQPLDSRLAAVSLTLCLSFCTQHKRATNCRGPRNGATGCNFCRAVACSNHSSGT